MDPTSRLIQGVKSNNFAKVKKALANGADVHIYHEIPLSWAISNRNFKMIEFLINCGSDVDAFLYNVLTISTLGMEGEYEILNLLISHCTQKNTLQTLLKDYTQRRNYKAQLIVLDRLVELKNAQK